MIISITSSNETIILINNFNLDKRFDSINLTKMTKLHYFLKNQNQIETKKWKTNLIFLNENKNQKSNLKI